MESPKIIGSESANGGLANDECGKQGAICATFYSRPGRRWFGIQLKCQSGDRLIRPALVIKDDVEASEEWRPGLWLHWLL